MLTSERVTSAFREAFFATADQTRLTPSECVLMAAAEKLLSAGACFSGVFHDGDVNHSNDNEQRKAKMWEASTPRSLPAKVEQADRPFATIILVPFWL